MNSELKSQVKDHWETETCGDRYATSESSTRYLEIEESRYELIPWMKDYVNFPQGKDKRVLEVGLGNGTDAAQWAKHGAHYTGVDLTNAAVEKTRENLEFRELPYLEIKTDDAEALSFDDNTFDIVYSWGVIHHSPDTQQALSEIRRVLKPGGKAIIMIYHSPCISDLILWARHGLLKGKPWRSTKYLLHHHLESPGTKAYSRKEATELCENSGFSDFEVETTYGQGDTLEMKFTEENNKPIFRLIQALYPSWIAKTRLGKRFGRCLLITATK